MHSIEMNGLGQFYILKCYDESFNIIYERWSRTCKYHSRGESKYKEMMKGKPGDSEERMTDLYQ